MKPPTWRLPEAPRPSRTTSRGTAALVCGGLVTVLATTGTFAGIEILLEPEGRLICSGEPARRFVDGILPDGDGGWNLLTIDERPRIVGDDFDAFLIHLDSELRPLPIGDGLYANSPCGVPLLGGPLDQYPATAYRREDGGVTLAPATFVLFGPEPSQIFLQSYDRQWNPLWAPSPGRVSAPDIESVFPVLEPDGLGGSFMLWNERPDLPHSSVGHLVAARYDASGAAVWTARPVVTAGLYGGWSFHVLAPAEQGSVYVSFSEPRVDRYDFRNRIWVQKILSDGSMAWAAGGVPAHESPGEDDVDSSILPDGAGNAIVAFSVDGRVRVQKFSPLGERLWGPEGILLSEPVDPDPLPVFALSQDPVLFASDDGSYWALWRDDKNRDVRAIVARRFMADGSLPWPAPVTLFQHTSYAQWPGAAVLADGTLAVAWQDSQNTSLEDAGDIFVNAVDRRGRRMGPRSGVSLMVDPVAQVKPWIVRPGSSFPAPAPLSAASPQAIVFWSDARFQPPVDWYPSASIVAQAVAFRSEPVLTVGTTIAMEESTEIDLLLAGDDLDTGAVVTAGDGIEVEALVTPLSAEGPGDSLALHLRAAPAPEAAPGPHALTLTNPDGGSLTIPAFLNVTLDSGRVDVDRSGRVDGYDLALLAQAFGRTRGDATYSWRADIDADGLVDGEDLAALAARFGKRGPFSSAAR